MGKKIGPKREKPSAAKLGLQVGLAVKPKRG